VTAVALAERKLEVSKALLTRPTASLRRTWPRAAALLARQGIELAVGSLLGQRWPGAENAPFRAQLVCLQQVVGSEAAVRAGWCWVELSRACHHHPYELAPTTAELKAWIADAGQIVELAAQAQERR
jgi:hypothetical protein